MNITHVVRSGGYMQTFIISDCDVTNIFTTTNFLMILLLPILMDGDYSLYIAEKEMSYIFFTKLIYKV